MFVWSVVRCAAVATWLSNYGVDPLWYLVVDLSSSLPYGLCSAQVIGALFDGRHRAAVAWAVPTVAAFLAPDVYIFTAGQALPWLTYVVVGGFAGVAAVVAVRAGRRRLVAAQAAGVAPSGLLH